VIIGDPGWALLDRASIRPGPRIVAAVRAEEQEHISYRWVERRLDAIRT
jgi:hypothetical protein